MEKLNACHSEPFACHSDPVFNTGEESLPLAQGKLREESQGINRFENRDSSANASE